MEKSANIEGNPEAKDGSTVYEVSYLILPKISQEDAPLKASSIKEMILSSGGEIISDENPVLIDLAYPMTKVIQTVHYKASSGYFGWVKFEISKDGILAVKKSLDNNPDILRYLLIKTVRENTLLHGKMKLQREEKTKRDEEEVIDTPEATKEAPAEELDKSIDDLVIV